MTQPQPGTLQYIIHKRIPVSVTHDIVVVLLTDGTSVLRTRNNVRNTVNLDNLSHTILLQLWQIATPVDERLWRTLKQRQDESSINEGVDTLLQKLQASATPDADDLLSAARTTLQQTGKLAEWAKINNMVQEMTVTQLRQLLSFMLLILLAKTAGE